MFGSYEVLVMKVKASKLITLLTCYRLKNSLHFDLANLRWQFRWALGNWITDLNLLFFQWKTNKKILLLWCLWQHFVGQLLRKAVQITELKNTMVRRKDLGLIWNKTHSLFLNEMTLSYCQVCAGLNETFNLWVFLPSLKNISIKLTFEANWNSNFLFVKHWHKTS